MAHIVLGIPELRAKLVADGKDFLHAEMRPVVITPMETHIARPPDDDIGGTSDEDVGIGSVKLRVAGGGYTLRQRGGRGIALGVEPGLREG